MSTDDTERDPHATLRLEELAEALATVRNSFLSNKLEMDVDDIDAAHKIAFSVFRGVINVSKATSLKLFDDFLEVVNDMGVTDPSDQAMLLDAAEKRIERVYPK